MLHKNLASGEVKNLTELMTPTQRKYLEHAKQHTYIGEINAKRVMHLPVCMKCERVAIYDRRPFDPPPTFSIDPLTGLKVKSKPYVTCPQCGYHGPGGPPLKVHVKEV